MDINKCVVSCIHLLSTEGSLWFFLIVPITAVPVNKNNIPISNTAMPRYRTTTILINNEFHYKQQLMLRRSVQQFASCVLSEIQWIRVSLPVHNVVLGGWPVALPAFVASAVCLPVGCYHPHPLLLDIIITQSKGWYSFYRSTEGRRLSQPRWRDI